MTAVLVYLIVAAMVLAAFGGSWAADPPARFGWQSIVVAATIAVLWPVVAVVLLGAAALSWAADVYYGPP